MPRKSFLLLALLLSVLSGVAQTLRQASPWNSGVGLADRIADRPADWPLLTTQFSHVTPENCMKPDALRRTEQAWNFNQADKFVAFANSKDLKVVGPNTGSGRYSWLADNLNDSFWQF